MQKLQLQIDEASGDWSLVFDAGPLLMGSSTPPPREVIRLIEAALDLRTLPQPEPAPGSAPPVATAPAHPAGPSPADLAGRGPLEPPRDWVRAIPAARDWMHRNGVAFSRVRDIMNNPDHVEHLDRGITRLSGQGFAVIVGDDGETVLSVRPLVPIGQYAPNRRRASRGNAGTRRALPGDVREMVQLLRNDGFTVQLAHGGHWKVTHPDAPGKVVGLPATPSDHRWAENTRRDLRATFGYDPRETTR